MKGAQAYEMKGAQVQLRGPLRGLHNGSLVWISKPVVSHNFFFVEEVMSLLVFHYCVCTFLFLCHLSSLLLSYVIVSRLCRLTEFNLNRASIKINTKILIITKVHNKDKYLHALAVK